MKRVFVLDYDIISPLGIGKLQFKKNLKKNITAEKKIETFNVAGLELQVAAEITENLRKFYQTDDNMYREMALYDRKLELLMAVYNIMKDRIKDITKLITPQMQGIVLGIGADASFFTVLEEHLASDFDDFKKFLEIKDIKKFFKPYKIYTRYLSEKTGIQGLQREIFTACAASNQAITFATEYIRNGYADLILAGGTDSILNLISFISFDKIGALAPQSNPPGKTCKPFDIDRQGTLASESAGLAILVSEDIVKQFDFKPNFEIIGVGGSSDAYGITAPNPEGTGMKLAMQRAIKDAGIHLEDLDYINAHGTGTKLNDSAELNALISLFGEKLQKISISSTKDRHGHAIAAAGIQEFAVLCATMEDDFIPHTLNLQNPIEHKWFKPLMKENQNKKINIAMSANYGFGGVNSAYILKNLKYESEITR